jgi:hypothetical protein
MLATWSHEVAIYYGIIIILTLSQPFLWKILAIRPFFLAFGHRKEIAIISFYFIGTKMLGKKIQKKTY